MIKICSTKDVEFLEIANILFTQNCAKEIGYSPLIYDNMVFIYSRFGFVSYRKIKNGYKYDYGYIKPEYRNLRKYDELFKYRINKTKGFDLFIETKNEIVKKYLIKNDFNILKHNGQWTYFTKKN